MRRVISATGRALVTGGILILLFVAYQLWGTGLYTSREQNSLRDEFTSSLEAEEQRPAVTSSTTSSTAPSSTDTTAIPPSTTTTTLPHLRAALFAGEGGPIAQIRIPRIGLDKIVVQGITRPDLRKGPGHYPSTPLPGQEGNSAIAGHRTTYGAPFGDLNELKVGDRIFIRTVQGSFTYEVYRANLVVKPNEVHVLDPDPDRPGTLTLTTCNPKYSAAERLVVKAFLRQEPLPASRVSTDDVELTEAGLSGEEESSNLPTLLAGLVAAAVGALWWLLFHRHPSLVNWLLGVVPFAAALFVFYALLERILPGNY